jgi:hypothetical protein
MWLYEQYPREEKRNMKRFFQELFVCTLGSAVGGCLIAVLSWRLIGMGDRYDVLNGIFIGLPLGCILSLLSLKRFVYKEKNLLFINIILGSILSPITEVVCLFLIDTFGDLMFVIVPVGVSITFILSDRIALRFRKLKTTTDLSMPEDRLSS